MIVGRVSPQLDAIIRLAVRGPNGVAATMPFVIDTGFDGFLCLPPEQISALKLEPLGAETVVLGDGNHAETALYGTVVEWHGKPMPVLAIELEGSALVGMALLRGSQVTMQVVDDGRVQIEPLEGS